MTEEECDRAYLDVVLRWPCYGSMLYEVEQTYTSSVARNLWLAVNLEGISLIARGEKVSIVPHVEGSELLLSPRVCGWGRVGGVGVTSLCRNTMVLTEQEPLMVYSYEDIVSFSPSLRCLMIVVSRCA